MRAAGCRADGGACIAGLRRGEETAPRVECVTTGGGWITATHAHAAVICRAPPRRDESSIRRGSVSGAGAARARAATLARSFVSGPCCVFFTLL